MDDDSKAKAGETGKRPAPTIELTAEDVSAPASGAADAATTSDGNPSEDHSPTAHSETSADSSSFAESVPPPPSRAPSLILSAMTGAVAAVLVVGAAKLAGWPAAPAPVAPVLTNTANKSEVDALGARLAKVESDAAKPSPQSAADPAVTARIGALEKSLASLRDDISAARGQSDKAIAALSDIKSSQPQALVSTDPQTAPAIDTSAIEERLGKIERATAALSATVAAPPVPPPPADDPKLRKIAAATLLDSSVRQGEPYAAALAVVRTTADDGAALKPLDAFASTGVPSANALCRELLALLPQLAPKQDAPAAPSGIVERLQQSATKLVRIQRTDSAASGNAGILARVAVAAQRDDVGEAKRELNALPAQDRAPAQAWIAKADAREAALAASRQFASDTMTALSKPAR